MVFSSLQFLFLFLPAVLVIYLIIKPKLANFWLMISSLAFYYIGDKEHISLLCAVILVAFISGLVIRKCKKLILKKASMVIALSVLIALMFYYKYWDFMLGNLNAFFGKSYKTGSIVLPIGISFFCFQAISYIVDVYRKGGALTNPIDLSLYISFFPQLIAGPIVRFHDIHNYLDKRYRCINWDDVESGIWRFCVGLSKKVLLANNLGGLADIVFDVKNISQFSVMYSWLGAIAYTLQIYFDFSGYSDMAIGLGRVFGFRFQENFEYPYAAASVKDFWRRWHISLSQFFRDYVYIPFGGAKCSKPRWAFNLIFVWLLTGFWHGASWNYILWGMLYGIILILEKLVVPEKKSNGQLEIARHVYTMLIVILLWVIFRADSVHQAMLYLGNMFGIGAKSFIDHGFIFQAENFMALLIIAALCASRLPKRINERFSGNKVWGVFRFICLSCCTVSSVSFIYMGSYNPFLYFMF